MKDKQTILIIIAIAAACAFFFFGCKITCSKREGFQRQCLGGTCSGMQRSPVDYAMKSPEGWQQNPHYEALASVRFQPLDFGPIDLWSDVRKLDSGEMFKQYDQEWEGTGSQIFHMANDEKNRENNLDIGNYQFAETMSNLYSPSFGPQGYSNVEQDYNEPNPYFDKLYGGAYGLRFGKLI